MVLNEVLSQSFKVPTMWLSSTTSADWGLQQEQQKELEVLRKEVEELRVHKEAQPATTRQASHNATPFEDPRFHDPIHDINVGGMD